MSDLLLRPMTRDDWSDVAALIHGSTNAWYRKNRGLEIFACDPSDCEIFCATYEALDPGCCLLAIDSENGQIAGSCFTHPRSTHVSVGIVNVHPDYFGRGVARRLLAPTLARAEREGKPVRLVSSAMNLDSFSLYTRAGFVPRMAFQDMLLPVPESGLDVAPLPESGRVRPARLEDIAAVVALERELAGIERGEDYRHFLEDRDRIWSVSVLEGRRGGLDGFLVSVGHPASNLLGPGAARTEEDAAALIRAEMDRRRGRTPMLIVPVTAQRLVERLYSWGAKNCEIHFAQVRGAWVEPAGIVLPTFLPESG